MRRYGAWELKTGYRRGLALALVVAVLLHVAAAVIPLILPETQFFDPRYRVLQFTRNVRGLSPGMATAGPSKNDAVEKPALRMEEVKLPDEPLPITLSPPEIVLLPSMSDADMAFQDQLRVNHVAFRTGSRARRTPMAGMYYGTAGVDFPPAVIEKIQPDYPPEGLAYMFDAKVTVRALVGQAGDVCDAFVITDSGVDMGFEESALGAVRRWLFSPATKQGHPVPMWIDVPIQFRLFVVYDQGFNPIRKVVSRIAF
jgi:TonB family protein